MHKYWNYSEGKINLATKRQLLNEYDNPDYDNSPQAVR